MDLFSSTRTLLCYRSFVIAALIELALIVDCTSDKIFSTDPKMLGFYEPLPVYCDREYRSKYGRPDTFEKGIAAVKLIPHSGLSEEIDWGSEDEENQPVYPWKLSSIGYDSEFLSMEDKNPEFLSHDDDDDSSEFIDDRGEFRSLGRNLAPARRNMTLAVEDDELENPGRRYLRYGRGEEIGKLMRYTGRRTRVTFPEEPSSLAKKLNNFYRHRKSNRKFGRAAQTALRPYTVADTFGPIFDGRRHASGRSDDNLHRAVWSEDNCKPQRRIVGGYTVESPEELPYIAFVDTGCGGAIISDIWVLTAAHCIDE